MSSAPTIDDAGVPDRCLSLTVRSEWGHFGRIDRTVSKQTYRVIPRPTAAGLLAAIVGAPRDSYYETFAHSTSAVAISVAAPIRTQNVPILSTSTSTDRDDEHLLEAGATGSSKGVRVRYPNPEAHSQLYNYEFLMNPAYRIDVAVENDTFYDDLKTHLDDGRSQFSPRMGTSQCLASIDFHGETEPTATDATEVHSTVPGGLQVTRPTTGGVTISQERTHAYMEQDGTNRRTRGFVDYAFTTDGDDLPETDRRPTSRVDPNWRPAPIGVADDSLTVSRLGDRNVIFR